MHAADPLVRVRQLIALAGNNPSSEEARTAAYLACKAIREQGLVLLAPGDPRLLPRPASPPPPSPPPRPEPSKRPAAPTSSRWMRIHIRRGTQCRGCSTDLPKGERVWWRQGQGCRCLGCGKGTAA
jgi:hypothetical protein